MIQPKDVAAVLVTRGDVDLSPIIRSLPFKEVVVWNNSERLDQGAYGRYLAIAETKKKYIYFQDDDCLVFPEAIENLMDLYQPGSMVCNMPGTHDPIYLEHDTALIGWGSLFDREAPFRAHSTYQRYFRATGTRWRNVEADIVFPYLTKTIVTYKGHRNFEYAYADHRTYRQSGYAEHRLAALMCCELVRSRENGLGT